MAWWTTQLIFQGNKLIAEGIDPTSGPRDLGELSRAVHGDGPDMVAGEPGGEAPVGGAAPPLQGNRYTRVIVSGYALYGSLRGYYALGVGHWTVDEGNGRVYTTEASQHHTEPVSSLTPKQRAIVRDCLINISQDAWETSNLSFRQALEI
jgi:hypothetical protein